LAGLLLAAARAAPEEAKKPSIVVILSDDQGRGDYSAFGTSDIRTPNIDRLFRDGMAFDNFYANSCVCSPTRAALLTGRYPDRVGVPGVIREEDPANSWGWLNPDVTLLPALLKSAGYHTALVGKWHLGISSPNTPTERGFDRFQGFLGDMMDDYRTHRRHGLNMMRRDQTVIDPQGHATDLFTDWAVAYLEERAKVGRPFFLLLAYNAPHEPLQPPAEWLEKTRSRHPELPDKRAKLVALIEHMDHGVGQVLGALDRTGLADNTLVIFTSDNGGVSEVGANNGPWRGGKQHMFEGGLRVPGAARWPGHVAPGSRTSRPTLTMDIFATACAVAGVTLPPGSDSASFLPAILQKTDEATQRDLYFVRREGGPVYGGKTIEALRRGRWKLVHDSPFAPAALYDMEADPRETTDLAASQRKVFAELSLALQSHIQQGGRTPWQPQAR
jgi:arylsulfatase A-like enzyme